MDIIYALCLCIPRKLRSSTHFHVLRSQYESMCHGSHRFVVMRTKDLKQFTYTTSGTS